MTGFEGKLMKSKTHSPTTLQDFSRNNDNNDINNNNNNNNNITILTIAIIINLKKLVLC